MDLPSRGTASSYEDPPAGQEIFAEHGSFRLKRLSVNWLID